MAAAKKILLVEDEQLIREMYTEKFSDAGYQVLEAEDGLSGFELAKKEQPDVILLDIILPQMDGFTVLEKLKKEPKTKKIPVFFLTNLKQDEDVEKGKKLGAIDYLVKSSLTPAQVLNILDNFFKKTKK